MKILIDLQACQTSGSKNRGIGRYSMSLAQAMIRNGTEHEFWILLNGAFSETIETIKSSLSNISTKINYKIFSSPGFVSALENPSEWRLKVANILRTQVINEINPDIVHVSSLFEGLSDDAVTSVAGFCGRIPVGVTLYDLIPLSYPEQYLNNSSVREWYMDKVNELTKSDLLMGISNSAVTEACGMLEIEPNKLINISSAVENDFGTMAMNLDEATSNCLQRYGINNHFVMYTGGIDWRKNIESLILAYSKLPIELRKAHQLVLVCQADDNQKLNLLKIANDLRLESGSVILTGYVSDNDLICLYKSCHLFVFPSIHEGFGLPLLEAMKCGAVVVASNSSSMPEIIGRDDAMFDPRSIDEMSRILWKGIVDEKFRESLRASGNKRASMFSWDTTAKVALKKMEDLVLSKKNESHSNIKPAFIQKQLQLAMIAPVPPAQSGIADYTRDLVLELGKIYDISIIYGPTELKRDPIDGVTEYHNIAWFEKNHQKFDRIVYQMGNSEFHAHMFELMHKIPGILVLHDFFLGPVVNWMDQNGYSEGAYERALIRSLGYKGLELSKLADRWPVINQFPFNSILLDRALGVIVHSEFAKRLGETLGSCKDVGGWAVIPHLRHLPQARNQLLAKKELGIEPDSILICSFGHIGPSKLNDVLLRAWRSIGEKNIGKVHLVFVGKNDPGSYGQDLSRSVAEANKVRPTAITGFAERKLYELYLSAADFSVQLRHGSRGETSGAVLDCLAYGVPVIANPDGALAEYPSSIVRMVSNPVDIESLRLAIETMASSVVERDRRAVGGLDMVRRLHDPALIAKKYAEFIEKTYEHRTDSSYWSIIRAIGRISSIPIGSDIVDVTAAISYQLSS